MAEETGTMVVYISTSAETAPIARKLADGLEARGFRAVTSNREIAAGSGPCRVSDAVSRAECFLVLVVPKASPSPEQEREWIAILEQASGLTKKLIPLVAGSGEPPNFLKNWQALRVPEDDKRWAKFVEMIGNALRSTKKPKMTSMRKRDLQLWERRLDSIESFARQLKSQGM